MVNHKIKNKKNLWFLMKHSRIIVALNDVANSLPQRQYSKTEAMAKYFAVTSLVGELNLNLISCSRALLKLTSFYEVKCTSAQLYRRCFNKVINYED